MALTDEERGDVITLIMANKEKLKAMVKPGVKIPPLGDTVDFSTLLLQRLKEPLYFGGAEARVTEKDKTSHAKNLDRMFAFSDEGKLKNALTEYFATATNKSESFGRFILKNREEFLKMATGRVEKLAETAIGDTLISLKVTVKKIADETAEVADEEAADKVKRASQDVIVTVDAFAAASEEASPGFFAKAEALAAKGKAKAEALAAKMMASPVIAAVQELRSQAARAMKTTTISGGLSVKGKKGKGAPRASDIRDVSIFKEEKEEKEETVGPKSHVGSREGSKAASKRSSERESQGLADAMAELDKEAQILQDYADSLEAVGKPEPTGSGRALPPTPGGEK